MAARVPNTFRRSGGVYQVRLYWPTSICAHFPDLNPELRFSLRTHDPEEARSLVSEIVYNYRQVIVFIKENNLSAAVGIHRDIMTDLISRLVDSSRRNTLMHILHADYLPMAAPTCCPSPQPSALDVRHYTGDICNQTIIETKPDGTQRVFSDLNNPQEANREVAEFLSMFGTAPLVFGGNEGGVDQENPTVSEVAKEFTEKRVDDEDWSNPETLKNRQYRLAYIVDQLGPETIFRSLTRKDGKRLRLLFIGRMKAEDSGKSKSQGRLGRHTARKYFQLFGALAQFALDEEYHRVDISRKLTIKASKQETNPYIAFSNADVEKLVNGFIYTCTEQPREKSYLSAYFWGPLIGLYTGVRLNEMCQMTVRDIECRAGVWFFCLEYEESEAEKKSRSKDSHTYKNVASVRLVPIHHVILDAGFLEYVEARKQSVIEPGRLFTGLTFDSKNRWGRKPGRWFNETFVPSLNLESDFQKVFHSLRHTLVKNLRHHDVNVEHIAAIVGHDGKSTTSRYGNDISDETLKWLKKLVERIDYGVSMEHISYARFLEFQYCKGQPAKKAHLLRAYRRT
ncbi:MAG: site-specific integrase [Motiliproteus sp.]